MTENKMIKALTNLLNVMKTTTGLNPEELKRDLYVIVMSQTTMDKTMKEAGFHAINDEGPGGFHAFEFLGIPIIADDKCPDNKIYLKQSPIKSGQ